MVLFRDRGGLLGVLARVFGHKVRTPASLVGRFTTTKEMEVTRKYDSNQAVLINTLNNQKRP
jgi:hypothetical protein